MAKLESIKQICKDKGSCDNVWCDSCYFKSKGKGCVAYGDEIDEVPRIYRLKVCKKFLIKGKVEKCLKLP
jgi:hypothetical protein